MLFACHYYPWRRVLFFFLILFLVSTIKSFANQLCLYAINHLCFYFPLILVPCTPVGCLVLLMYLSAVREGKMFPYSSQEE